MICSSFLRACMDVPVSNASRISSDFHGKGGIMSGIHEKQYKIRSQRFCQQALNESTSGGSVNRKDDVSRGALIWRAIKLPIYSVALVPLTVGGAAAYLQTGVFSAKRYFTLLISSVLIITWLNLRLVLQFKILELSSCITLSTAILYEDSYWLALTCKYS
ncbi:unnamed protein product [Linum tenue]|uniref:Uncharacterized protein n=1 Tax=Linum tenue TaxID=586396 RepID=A0AAV0GSS0_9ROSI|nr:unnamed protein product [Linum tenue]